MIHLRMQGACSLISATSGVPDVAAFEAAPLSLMDHIANCLAQHRAEMREGPPPDWGKPAAPTNSAITLSPTGNAAESGNAPLGTVLNGVAANPVAVAANPVATGFQRKFEPPEHARAAQGREELWLPHALGLPLALLRDKASGAAFAEEQDVSMRDALNAGMHRCLFHETLVCTAVCFTKQPR